MSRNLIAALCAILAGMALAACSERPARPDPEGSRGLHNQAPQNPLHERTLEQGEGERIGH